VALRFFTRLALAAATLATAAGRTTASGQTLPAAAAGTARGLPRSLAEYR
jgi:hypothetical protein